MVFHWSLNYSKFPPVSRTLLSILADLNNAVVWVVSIRPPNYELLWTIPSKIITIGTFVTFMIHSFLCSLCTCHSFCFLWFSCSSPFGLQSSLYGRFSFFVCVWITRPDLLVRIKLSVCISKSERISCTSFPWMNSSLSMMIKVQLLRQFPVNPLPPQSRLLSLY